MSAGRNLELNVTGGGLHVVRDSNREYPDFLQWHVSPDHMFGIAVNSKEVQSFLRNALKRLEKDAFRLRGRGESKLKHSTFSQRIEWLRAHRELLELPKEKIAREMKRAGLYAPTTYLADIRLDKELEAVKIL